MITMSVNGQSCDPSNCLVVQPGAWTFSGSAFANGNVVDATYSLQSIVPAASGGSVQVVVSADVGAGSVSAVQGGIGAFNGSVAVVNGSVIETLNLSVGASQSVGGDYLSTWIPVAPPPTCEGIGMIGVYPDCHVTPMTCPAPLIGTPPDCRQPVCTDCAPPPTPTCTVNCSPVAPPVPMPTLSEFGLIGLALMIAVAALASLRWKR